MEIVTSRRSKLGESNQQSMPDMLQEGLRLLHFNGELTDVEVQVEDTVYKCHRVVLAAISGYFRSLFSSNSPSEQKGLINIKLISKEGFENVLSFIYDKEDTVTTQTVDSLLQASVTLKIDWIEKRCVQFLVYQLSPSTCIRTWTLARKCQCNRLERKAGKMLMTKFGEASQTGDFDSLSESELVSILATEKLLVKNEDTICAAVLRWLNADVEARKSSAGELFQYVCLPLVSGSFLFDQLYSSDLVHQDPRFAKMVKDAVCYHLKPENRDAILSQQMTVRSHPDFGRVAVIIGGKIYGDDCITSVGCCYLSRRDWYTIASLPHDIGLDFATCTLANEIFLSGGSRSLDKFMKYCPGDNEWIMQPSLITGRECHAMVAVNSTLYILGGRNRYLQTDTKLPADIEAYDNDSGRWFVAGRLQIPVESVSAAAVGQKIFMFGGVEGDGDISSIIQCFDVTSGTCQVIGSLPCQMNLTRAIAINSRMYVTCSDGQVFLVSSDGVVEKVAEIPTAYRTGFAVYNEQHKLVIVGGENDEGIPLDDIIAVDLTSGRVTVRNDKLPIPITGLSMETIVIPKAMLVQRGFSAIDASMYGLENSLVPE